MIVQNRQLQCMECDQCRAQVEIRRSVLRDPEQMLNLIEELTEQHKNCVRPVVESDRERAERIYRAGMKAEMEKLAA
jgi:hypothetical protein